MNLTARSVENSIYLNVLAALAILTVVSLFVEA
jgi:hypothetical protein